MTVLDITITMLDHDEFMTIAPNRYARGWVSGHNITVCKDHYDLELIAHEIGHILNKKHTWLPFMMHPSGAFRLANIPSTIIKIIRHMM